MAGISLGAILGTVGGLAGTAIGGPAGASIGGSLGGLLGGGLDSLAEEDERKKFGQKVQKQTQTTSEATRDRGLQTYVPEPAEALQPTQAPTVQLQPPAVFQNQNQLVPVQSNTFQNQSFLQRLLKNGS